MLGFVWRRWRETDSKLRCKSAPKWDPSRIRNKPLIWRQYLPGDGVPMGVDWDPTKPSFSSSVPSKVSCEAEKDAAHPNRLGPNGRTRPRAGRDRVRVMEA